MFIIKIENLFSRLNIFLNYFKDCIIAISDEETNFFDKYPSQFIYFCSISIYKQYQFCSIFKN